MKPSYLRSELHIGGLIYTLIDGVSWDSPVNDAGTLTVTFTDESERQRLTAKLLAIPRGHRFQIIWKHTPISHVFDGCRVLSLMGLDDITFSFLHYLRKMPTLSRGAGGRVLTPRGTGRIEHYLSHGLAWVRLDNLDYQAIPAADMKLLDSGPRHHAT